MKEKTKTADVGIIVGRFQCHELHSAHIDLIKTVSEKHDRVIIFLGNSPVRNTINNPLDFRARRIMIQESFPDIDVFYIKDVNDDTVWSTQLDILIRDSINPYQTVLLYGSRDSFLNSYNGMYDICELEAETVISATEIRKKVSNNYFPSAEYRAGVIAATSHRYPICYQTVDVAILNNEGKILLCKKPYESKYRFIGGFSDPKSSSLEADVRREVSEEADIEITNIRYVTSRLIDDWRYKKEVDKIKTALFCCNYLSGRIQAGDDVSEVKWFNIADFERADYIKQNIVPEHHELMECLICELTKTTKNF